MAEKDNPKDDNEKKDDAKFNATKDEHEQKPKSAVDKTEAEEKSHKSGRAKSMSGKVEKEEKDDEDESQARYERLKSKSTGAETEDARRATVAKMKEDVKKASRRFDSDDP